MNKSHYVLLAMLFSVQAVFGWNLAINNQTRFQAHVWVYYKGCNYDHRIISPGGVAHINAKECLVSKIEGVLVTVPGDSSKNLPISGYKPGKATALPRDFSIAIIPLGWGKNPLLDRYAMDFTYF